MGTAFGDSLSPYLSQHVALLLVEAVTRNTVVWNMNTCSTLRAPSTPQSHDVQSAVGLIRSEAGTRVRSTQKASILIDSAQTIHDQESL